jgi:hypothetical protein
VAFVLAWSVRHDVRTAVIASGAILLVLLILRLARRSSVRYVLSAVFATAIAAFFALRSGTPEAAFLPGILTSAGWGLASLFSVLVRWPIVGFMVAAGDPRLAEDPTAWRRDRGLVTVCQRLTMVLVVLYAVRVVIMFPLYLGHQVTLLGVSKVVLGWPAYLCALAIMGAMLMKGKTALDPNTPPTSPSPSPAAEPPA